MRHVMCSTDLVVEPREREHELHARERVRRLGGGGLGPVEVEQLHTYIHIGRSRSCETTVTLRWSRRVVRWEVEQLHTYIIC